MTPTDAPALDAPAAAPAPAPTAAPSVSDAPPPGDPRAALRRLREENKRRRLSERTLRAELDRLQARLAVVTDNLNRAFGDDQAALENLAARVPEERRAWQALQQTAGDALVRACFDLEAARRKVAFPDETFALLDRGAIAVDLARGRVTGLDQALDALIAARPHLVGAEAPAPYGTEVPTAAATPAAEDLRRRARDTGSNHDLVAWWRARAGA